MKHVVLAVSLALAANGAAANDFGPAIQGYLDTHLRGWVNDPALVAASDTTSDYRQGDEAKFIQTYPNGANAVHIGKVEFDESTQSYVEQVSLSVVDPADSAVVGAITVALRADMLF